MKKLNHINESWESLTPGELKNAKIFSIIFIAISLSIFIFLNKIIGMILLVIWVAFGSGPFVLGSRGSIKNMIHVLKIVEPGYNDWQNEEIEKQIKAIQECGYKWFEQKGRVGFKHSKTGLFLIIEGLHCYKPEDIKRIYRKIWSKSDPNNVKRRDLTAQKLQKAILDNGSDEEIESILKEHQKDKIERS